MVRGVTLVACLSNLPDDEISQRSDAELPLVTASSSSELSSGPHSAPLPQRPNTSCGFIDERDNSRVKQEAQQYFAEQEKDMERASREAGAVLRHIEAQARERAGESLVPNFRHTHLAKLQAWGSFRDAMEQYSQLLSSPSKAHPAVAREMEFLRRGNAAVGGDGSLSSSDGNR